MEAFVVTRRPFPESSRRIEIDVRVGTGRGRVVVSHVPSPSAPARQAGELSLDIHRSGGSVRQRGTPANEMKTQIFFCLAHSRAKSPKPLHLLRAVSHH